MEEGTRGGGLLSSVRYAVRRTAFYLRIPARPSLPHKPQHGQLASASERHMKPRAPRRERGACMAQMRLAALACLAAAALAFEPPSADWQRQMGAPVGPAEAAALREEVREMARGFGACVFCGFFAEA